MRFRELKADSDATRLEEDLLYLTADTHEHRHLYGVEEAPRVDLTQAEGDDAAQASKDAKADFEKKGVKLSNHYYRVSERAQTGEIQETFEIEEAKRRDGNSKRKEA